MIAMTFLWFSNVIWFSKSNELVLLDPFGWILTADAFSLPQAAQSRHETSWQPLFTSSPRVCCSGLRCPGSRRVTVHLHSLLSPRRSEVNQEFQKLQVPDLADELIRNGGSGEQWRHG